jgi:transketolase
MRRAFGKTIVRLAEKDSRIVLLTGDVEQEMGEYKERFGDRFFNLGLTEQSIISVAAGLAIEGLRPVVYSITPFVLERPFEQIKIDIDEQNLPVMLVGNDDYPTHGPTHRALNAQRLCSCFKNVQAFFPMSSAGAEKAMLDAYLMGVPAFIGLKNDRLPFL